MKTKEIYRTGNISYMISYTADLKEKNKTLTETGNFPLKFSVYSKDIFIINKNKISRCCEQQVLS